MGKRIESGAGQKNWEYKFLRAESQMDNQWADEHENGARDVSSYQSTTQADKDMCEFIEHRLSFSGLLILIVDVIQESNGLDDFAASDEWEHGT